MFKNRNLALEKSGQQFLLGRTLSNSKFESHLRRRMLCHRARSKKSVSNVEPRNLPKKLETEFY